MLTNNLKKYLGPLNQFELQARQIEFLNFINKLDFLELVGHLLGHVNSKLSNKLAVLALFVLLDVFYELAPLIEAFVRHVVLVQ